MGKLDGVISETLVLCKNTNTVLFTSKGRLQDRTLKILREMIKNVMLNVKYKIHDRLQNTQKTIFADIRKALSNWLNSTGTV